MITPKAKKHLSQADPKMACLMKNVKVDRFQIRENEFRALVGSIISQQLSTKAASTINQRMRVALGSDDYTHKHLLRIAPRKLRVAGLSGSKVKYIKGLAEAMEQKKLNFKKIREMDDEQVIAELIKFKGIGRWTAEMFLIFSLGRPDVFSTGDGGLRNALMKIYKLKDLKNFSRITDKWKPYRSIASLYLWASLDNQPKNG